MYKTHFNKHIARLAFALLLGTTALTSCNDFLDVRPKGENLEADQFKTPAGLRLPYMECTAPCSRARSTAWISIGDLPT